MGISEDVSSCLPQCMYGYYQLLGFTEQWSCSFVRWPQTIFVCMSLLLGESAFLERINRNSANGWVRAPNWPPVFWSLMEETHYLAARLYPQLQSPKPGLSCFLCFPGEPRLEPLKRMKLQSLSEVREGHSVVGLGGEQEECCRADSSLCKHFFSSLFKNLLWT